MNTFFVKTLRIMMLFLFIISLALGYVIYEDTLAVWWIPVGVALLIALATLPFYRKWSWLTTTEGKVMNVLCHIGCVGAISYALFLSGNYWLAGTASIYEETVMVQKKYIETHKKPAGSANIVMYRMECVKNTICRLLLKMGMWKRCMYPLLFITRRGKGRRKY